MSDVGTEATSKEAKFAAVLAFAHNKRNGRGRVALSPQEVKGCTGVSRRYACELIDAMGADVDGVEVREAQSVRTGSGAKRKGKALLVDSERVREVSDVNQATTGGEYWGLVIGGDRQWESVSISTVDEKNGRVSGVRFVCSKGLMADPELGRLTGSAWQPK